MAWPGWLGDGTVNGFDGFIRANEKFEFHLLELARTESKIARVDLVAEGFADLADTERHLLTGGFEDVFELREDGLSSFRADVGLEHQIEWARLGQQAAIFRIIRGRVLELAGAFPKQSRVLEAALLVE